MNATPDAITTLWAAVAGGEGWLRVRFESDGEPVEHWLPALDRRRCVRVLRGVARLELRPVVHRTRDNFTTVHASVLWCQLTAGKQWLALRRLPPATLLVRDPGSKVRGVALWALDRSLPEDWFVRANRRIAHAVGAPKKGGAPGAFVRWGDVVECRPTVYAAREVVGRLPEAPDPNAWRDRAAA